MAKLKLDLHGIFNKGHLIERELKELVQEAIDKRIPLIEIIPGKGSGQLHKGCIEIPQPTRNKISRSPRGQG